METGKKFLKIDIYIKFRKRRISSLERARNKCNAQLNRISSNMIFFLLVLFLPRILSVGKYIKGSNDTFYCPIRQESVIWNEYSVSNPSVVKKDGKFFLFYTGTDSAMTSRIGLAWSHNYSHFEKRSNVPILFPNIDENIRYEWDGGCKSPRIVQHPDGHFVMTYTSLDSTMGNMMHRLSIATSNDLLVWRKHGPAFREHFVNAWTTSGSILIRPDESGNNVAAKINGKFHMYWGSYHIHMATSDDLLSWEPILEDNFQVI